MPVWEKEQPELLEDVGVRHGKVWSESSQVPVDLREEGAFTLAVVFVSRRGEEEEEGRVGRELGVTFFSAYSVPPDMAAFATESPICVVGSVMNPLGPAPYPVNAELGCRCPPLPPLE